MRIKMSEQQRIQHWVNLLFSCNFEELTAIFDAVDIVKEIMKERLDKNDC